MFDIAMVGNLPGDLAERSGSGAPQRNRDRPRSAVEPDPFGYRPGHHRARCAADDPDQSDLDRWTHRLQESDGVRWNRVYAAREAIASGTFLTSSRLEGALDGLLDDLVQ